MNSILLNILPNELSRFEYLIPRLADLLQVALILAVTFGGVFAVYLGVKLAVASDNNKRSEAKKHIITFIVSMVLVVFLIYLVKALTSFAQNLI